MKASELTELKVLMAEDKVLEPRLTVEEPTKNKICQSFGIFYLCYTTWLGVRDSNP